MTRTAVIVGNGLAGPLLAVLLARYGWRVKLFERRGDPRAKGYQGGRSINLALSARGLSGLAAAGLDGVVRERDLIPMPGRMMHARNGKLTFQPYSKDPGDAINSVSRGGLSLTLIREAAAIPGVEFAFDHLCMDADVAAGVAVFKRLDGSEVRVQGDLLIGADGAFSAVRGAMQKTDRFEYSQSYLGHGYKELVIPAKERDSEGARQRGSDGGRAAQGGEVNRGLFAMEPNALHIWPRGGAMMIALPNRDGSFTCTLFWPFEGEHSFANLRSEGEVGSFFREQYGDAVPQMPTLERDYMRNPTSSLVTVRCWPWQHSGRTVLLGDAAHAIVPFYGQGINCGFEDCVELASCLKKHRDQREALEAYQAARKPNADAIADMALENFVEMRDKVGQPEFLYRKRVEQTVHALFEGRWSPQYNLVSFSTVSYVEARRRGRELDSVLDRVIAAVPAEKAAGMSEEEFRGAVRGAVDGNAQSAKLNAQIGTAAELIDITPVVSSRLGVWPGDTPVSREVLCDIAKGDTVTLSTLRATVHLGAHADGPNHYGLGAPDISKQRLEHYLGPCQVIEAKVARGSRVRVADLRMPIGEVKQPRVLIKTGTFPDPEKWNSDFAALTVELVEALAARGVITIGIDTPSVDLQESKTLEAHKAILKHGIAILEGLVLRDVAAGEYELIALPLRLEGFDASPVRAVLRRPTVR
ncbi:MAG: FAD-dependent monooxygenase [Phycisphaeraceae bacterium]|nr:FAD-dependent monooxygenase [Phycisphaeraceae bacterium]